MTTLEIGILVYSVVSIVITVMMEGHAKSQGRNLSIGVFIMALLLSPVMFPISLWTALRGQK